MGKHDSKESIGDGKKSKHHDHKSEHKKHEVIDIFMNYSTIFLFWHLSYFSILFLYAQKLQKPFINLVFLS
jgi:hypothetical protein